MGPIELRTALAAVSRPIPVQWCLGLGLAWLLFGAACAPSAETLRPLPRPTIEIAPVIPRPAPVARVSTPTIVVARPTAAPAATRRAKLTPTPLAATRRLEPTDSATADKSTTTPTPTIQPTPTLTVIPTSTETVAPTQIGRQAITISRGPTGQNVVALTFDAGADRGEAPQLLAYLEANGINASFGMTGRWAESNPDLVRRIAADGDQLMNHTYDHRSFTGLSAKPAVLTLQDRLDEIDRTDAIIQQLTGMSSKPYFRPPYGDQDPAVLEAVATAGYRYSVLWTIDSLGWRGLPVNQIVDRCLQLAEPGAIYVMHVGEMSQDIEALPTIVNGLKARGFRFATLDGLLTSTSP